MTPTRRTPEGEEEASSRRNAWLRLHDAALLKDCHQERYRASGPGGQRRNKVETAIRLHHRPSGLVAQAEESRSPEENRRRAIRRLREGMALELRSPFDLEAPPAVPELAEHVGPEGALSINPRNRAYPIVVATVLDALEAAEGSYAKAARALSLSTSQVLRFSRSDAQVWRAVQEARRRRAAQTTTGGAS